MDNNHQINRLKLTAIHIETLLKNYDETGHAEIENIYARLDDVADQVEQLRRLQEGANANELEQ